MNSVTQTYWRDLTLDLQNVVTDLDGLSGSSLRKSERQKAKVLRDTARAVADKIDAILGNHEEEG
jgi:hypothetical protein